MAEDDLLRAQGETTMHQGVRWRLVIGAVLLPLLFTPAVVPSQQVYVREGFWGGNQWRDAKYPEQHAYATGVLDGITLASALATAGENLSWMRDCSTGMRSDQVHAMVEKEIDGTPGEWHKRLLHLAVYRAFLKACPNAPK